MKNEVMMAKSLLESKGYEVSKIDEGHVDGIGYVDPMTMKRWRQQEEEYEKEHPTEKWSVSPEDMKAQGAIQASDVKVGDLIKHDFDQSERDIDPESIWDYEVAEIHTDDNENWYDIRFVTTDGEELHWDNDDFVGYRIDPSEVESIRKDRAKNDLKTYESNKMDEPAKEYKGYTIEYYVDSDDYSNYSEHRVKISKNGKVVTTLSAEKDPQKYIDNLSESTSFDEKDILHKLDQFQSQITVSKSDEKAMRDILDKKHISYQIDDRNPGKLKFRLRYNESKDTNEHLEVAPNHTTTTAEKVAYVKKMVKKAKEEGDEHSAWDIVDFLYDSLLLDEIPLDESREEIEESTDDRQQRRIVKNIADEVIRAKGQNNSTGTYDAFIRKMVANWATSGQDRDFIKAAIEKSYDKEFKANESKDLNEYTEFRCKLPAEWSDDDHEYKVERSMPGRYVLSVDGEFRTWAHNLWDIHDTLTKDYHTEIPGTIHESKNPLQESILRALDSLKESNELNYEDLRTSNPSYVANKIARALGPDATEEELMAEISKVIDSDYDYLGVSWRDQDNEELVNKKVAEVRQIALERALKIVGWEKESMSHDPMNGHKYQVGGATPNVTETGTDYNVHDGGYFEDPEQAILAWLKLSQKAPTMISIDTNKNVHAQELLKWVVKNEDKFREYCEEYKCPYHEDFLVHACAVKLEKPTNFETKYNHPDQIYPFALG